MRGYWFIGNREIGFNLHYKLCQMVLKEQKRIVENYCGKKAEDVDPHIWKEFFYDCFGRQTIDESVGEGEYEQLIYFIDKDKICVRSCGKNTLEARFIRFFRPRLK